MRNTSDSRSSLASLVRERSRRQRLQRAVAGDMAASNFADLQAATPHIGREEAVDRSSRGSESSVPSMVDDHGSETSIDDDQYYRTSGDQIWDTFWHSGCSDEEEEQPAQSPSYQYPALITPSLSVDTQHFPASRKPPTQSQSLGAIEAPAYAEHPSAGNAQTRPARRHVNQPCRASYSIFPPQDEISRQRTIRARRCPPHLKLDAPKPRVSSASSPRHSLRSSASARNLRSGSASSAFSASSAYSTSTDVSMASDTTAITTPAASPRGSWDCPRTPKPTHVSQCMDFRKATPKQPSVSHFREASKQPSLPNLRGPTRYRPVQPHSATVEDFASGEARNARVVGAVATTEPYPRPLFAPPVGVSPLQPSRRAPLPPVSERLPPPVSATRPKRPIPAPLSLTRPLPPLPFSASRPQTPLSAPPRPQRPDHPHHFGPALSPPRPAGPPRASSQSLPARQGDFQPPVVSVFEWDSEPDSDSEAAGGNAASNSFAKRIARGFANIQANTTRKDREASNSSRRVFPPAASSGDRSDELTRIRSGETVTRFSSRPVERPSRQRALTVEDIRRVEEDMDRLKLAREQVALERSSTEVVVPRGPKRQKSAIFGRMLGWRTQ